MTIPEFQTIFSPIHAVLVTSFVVILFLHLRTARKIRKEVESKKPSLEEIINNCNINIKHANTQIVGGLICAASAMVMGDVIGVIIYCVIGGFAYTTESANQAVKLQATQAMKEINEAEHCEP